MHSLVDNFKKDGPFSASLACPEALEKVATFKDQVTSLKDQEAQIRRGLGIFKIEQPPNKDIATLDKVTVHCCIAGYTSYHNVTMYNFM